MALIERAHDAWNAYWFRPASPLGLTATRVLAATNALWLVLSRPDLPDALVWPPGMLRSVDAALSVRFLLGLPVALEWALFVALHVALLAALFGIGPRVSSAASALLLYHFAPFTELITGAGGVWFEGLTHPILILLLVAFAEAPRRHAPWSAEYRWPLAAARFLIVVLYFYSGVGKLLETGLSWASAEHVRAMVLGQQSRYALATPWADWVVARPWVCWTIGVGTLVAELAWPLALVSGLAASILVPVTLAGHVGIVGTLGLVFPNWPLVLLFLDWDAVDRRLADRWSASRSPTGAEPRS